MTCRQAQRPIRRQATSGRSAGMPLPGRHAAQPRRADLEAGSPRREHVAVREVHVLVAFELRDLLPMVELRVQEEAQRLVDDDQPAAGLEHPKELAQRAPQVRRVVVMQDLAAEDVVHALAGDRRVVHHRQQPLEVDLAGLEEDVRRPQSLQLRGRDVQRDDVEAPPGEDVAGPARVRADVEQGLAGFERDSPEHLVHGRALRLPVPELDPTAARGSARDPSRRCASPRRSARGPRPRASRSPAGVQQVRDTAVDRERRGASLADELALADFALVARARRQREARVGAAARAAQEWER